MDVGRAASALVEYAVSHGLIEGDDRIWAYNTVLGAVGQRGPAPAFPVFDDGSFDLQAVLAQLGAAATQSGISQRFPEGEAGVATQIMGSLMPRPAAVNRTFGKLFSQDPQKATDWFYRLCCDGDYVRRAAIERDIKWTSPTEWGTLEITINRSKPEKDPLDIARAAVSVDASVEPYPACQLCMENVGYSGRTAEEGGVHPARQNLRIVPIQLGGQDWGLQYSPYSYYNEHCIAMSEHHVPMRIDRGCIDRLLDFVDLFPHYFIGSNADLPIVGGSILSHDHFQGGRHVFPMDRAPIERAFDLPRFPDVRAGIVRWPVSVIRLQSADRSHLAAAAWAIIAVWRGYDDVQVGIVSESDGLAHNTVTPIAHKTDGGYTLDLALRCNITSPEHPLGVFHPHAELHHIKKENIGLIEVMGLAILPPRLARELGAVSVRLLQGKDMESDPLTVAHATWARVVANRHPEFSEFNSYHILHDEVGLVFAQVLEDVGVFKWDDRGRAAFARFIDTLS